MSGPRYKVVYECTRCGHIDETQRKADPRPPSKCRSCGSTRTRKIRSEKV